MKHVLFVCTHNAGRSQMAQAFFNLYAPDDIRGISAGSDPADAVWPAVVDVMAERGIDLDGEVPKKLTVEMQLRADWAVTLGCADHCPFVPTTVEDWDIPDPAGRPMDEVRRIRDLVERHVQNLVATELGAIREDRTIHEQWLRQLLPALTREFADACEPEEIRACADAVLSEYDNVRIRSFVVTLALREARERLRGQSTAILVG